MVTTNRPKSQPASPRRTRWWTYAAGLLCLALAWPLIQYNLAHWRLQRALGCLEKGDNAAAVTLLEAEEQSQPDSADIAYWLAVAHRRSGHFRLFREYLQRAQELGYAQSEIARQVLMLRMQSGEIGPEIDEQSAELIEHSEEYAGARPDLFIDEFYEARSRGALANFRVRELGLALDKWVEARPMSIPARLMRASSRERESNFQAAEEEYREVLALAPDNLPARLQRASLLLRNLKVQEAAEEFRRCLEIAPGDIHAQIGLSECEYRSGQGADEARQRLEGLLTGEIPVADRGEALYLLGEICRSQKQNEQTIKFLEEAIRIAPTSDARPYRTLGSAYASVGKRAEAEKWLKISNEKLERTVQHQNLSSRITQSPEDAQLRYEQGQYFMEDGRQDQAVAWWNMAVRMNPRLQEAHEALADYYDSQGDHERAAFHQIQAEQSAAATFNKLWQELLDSNTKAVREGLPKLERYASQRGEVELLTLGIDVVERKDLEHAARGLGRLTNNPKLRMRSLAMLAEALYVMGHLNASERAYLEVLASSPKNVIAHRGLESIYYDIGDYDRMEVHALQVAKIDETDYRPHRHMGYLRREAESWEAAIRDYKESLLRSPHQPTREEVLLEMVDCFIHLQKYQEALDTLKDVRRSAQKLYLEAQCKYATKQVGEAKKLLDEALELSADHVPSLLLRSDIALIDDDAAAARTYLDVAVKAAPFDNSAHQKLSTVLLRLDEKDAARKEADRAKELLDLQLRFSELSTQATQRPRDIAIRRELATLSRQLGREEEAKRWDRVVDGLTEDPLVEIQPEPLLNKKSDGQRLEVPGIPKGPQVPPKSGPPAAKK